MPHGLTRLAARLAEDAVSIEAVRGVIAGRFGEQSMADPAAPAPAAS